MESDATRAQKHLVAHRTIRKSAYVGAHNLLHHCAGLRRGQSVLLVCESPGLGYYDAGLAPLVGSVAKEIGIHVDRLCVPFRPETPHLPDDLRCRMEQVDVTVFLARLGDQLRFSAMPAGRSVACFAVTPELLAAPFGTGRYDVFAALKGLVDTAIARARSVRVTCPAGTDFAGRPEIDRIEDTSLSRFPISVFAPVPGAAFSGCVALPGFLVGTGSRYYDDYVLRFDGPVTAHFTCGRLTGFDGARADVARAARHYDRIARRYGIDRDRIHSWHAGIHPGCGFPWPAFGAMERWSGVGFGNPRILHLHSCGAEAPGEISLNVIDPTIWIDGVAVWDDGAFHPERLNGGAEILARCAQVAAVFAAPDRRIGLCRAGQSGVDAAWPRAFKRPCP